MSILLTILAVIIIFSLLVLIHEAGHFIAARRAGIKVLEFGIGFPPRLFAKKIGETTYTINAIPFGGFVKLFGEDATSPDIINNKRSFAHKSPWIRTKVVIAGVFMNFILAIALLTLGFSFGIEPLLVTEQDLFNHLAAGNVQSAPGVYISKVTERTKALGLAQGDHIIAVDDKPITNFAQLRIFEKGGAVGATAKDIDVIIAGTQDKAGKRVHVPLVGKEKSYGIDLAPVTSFPRLTILEVRPNSASSKAGLRRGDTILQMNGKEVYAPTDFEEALTQAGEINFAVLRGSDIQHIIVKLPDSDRVVIAEVSEASAAAQAGLKKGDTILSINGEAVTRPEQVQNIIRTNPGRPLVYKVDRPGKGDLKITASTGAENVLGIALSSIVSFRNTEVSFYRDSIMTSITHINKVRYAPWKAFKQAISESVRLTGLTIQAFGRTIGSIISKFAVPSDIGGPVQIAYYTHTFIQEGFFALLRFTALLSLSLAVINVLPIPALDGGRLLFILIEVVFKKRVNARIESMVHMVGFILLLTLIVLVTYSDITKLF